MKILPAEFKERMQDILGNEQYSDFENSLNAPVPVSFRINPLKFNKTLTLEKVQWCNKGFYIPERPLFAADPLWHAGAYYVQEAGSMALEQAFKSIKEKNKEPLSVLDLCAAPGGKSTHIASLLNEEDVLVANEVIKTRVGILNENLTKWGYPNIIITNSDSKDFDACGELFDVIVVDAPCSGEGLFRKDENAISEWSVANTELCTLRQKRILSQIINCLKPGGFLIYSTCTYNPNENESQVSELLKDNFTGSDFSFNGKTNFMHQCYPHLVKGEGFFIALLQKNNGNEKHDGKGKINGLKPVKPIPEFKNYVLEGFGFYERRDQIIALNERTKEMYEALASFVNIYSAGTEVCDKNDKLFSPSPYLPFSNIVNTGHFETKEVEYVEAILFLSKQILPNQSLQKGFVIIQHNKVNLGFGKFAGNRINNLFPNEWRLRRTIKPEEYFSIETYS